MVKVRHSRKVPSPALIVVKDTKRVQFLADMVYPFVAGVWVSRIHCL